MGEKRMVSGDLGFGITTFTNEVVLPLKSACSRAGSSTPRIPLQTAATRWLQGGCSMKNRCWSRVLRLVAVLATTFGFTVCAQATAKYMTIRNFNPNSGGGIPYGGLLADQAGNLYGANSSGGTGNWGTIFELTPNRQQGWTYSVVYDCGTTMDCAVPMGSLAMDQAGNLYGVTYFGNVFEVTRSGSEGWTATVLHAFTGGVDGNAPSPLILDAEGNLYGANATGGRDNLGYVFEVSISEGRWSLTHLYDFTGRDGAETINTAGGEVAALIQDASGILYGTTSLGGTSTKCKGGCGVVFQLKNDSGTWTETTLHSFTGTDGSNPDAALLMDAAGKLYGTATGGGANGLGVVFEMSQSSGTWRTRVLHSFTGLRLDGAYPNSALVMDTAGNLYGATFAGGGGLQTCQVLTDVGCGVVFALSPAGTKWKASILHAFTGGIDGAFPGGVILDTEGNLYGGAESGGQMFDGLVFKIASATSATQ